MPALLALCSSLLGCEATLGSDADERSSTSIGGDRASEPERESECADCASSQAVPDPHFVRLTHAQWGHAVRDIFEFDEVPPVVETFSLDAVGGTFSTMTDGLNVHQSLWLDYERASETVARSVRTTETLDALAPERDRDAFLQKVGRRCYRRPLTDRELARYQALFDGAADYLNSGDDFADGAEMFTRACLQSPHFLYRTELTTEGKLDGFELAARLALSLWGTSPPDELLDAASAGELDTPAGVALRVDAMLADERARAGIERYHGELLHWDSYQDITKDAERYPGFHGDSPSHLVTEARLFLDEVIHQQGGTFSDVLTEPTSFVNAELARVYGLSGQFDEEFVRVELDPRERAGLLTQLGFLTKNANAVEQDPIHRGVSVAIEIACTPIPPPPDNIEVPDVAPGVTVRERVSAVTAAPACAACHETFINPVGFAFGNYDGDGSYITMDAGAPIDASGSFPLDGEPVSFENAVDFSQALAASEQVHRCYAGHLLEYFYGRGSRESDEATLRPLTQGSLGGDMSVLDIVRALMTSEAFLSLRGQDQ